MGWLSDSSAQFSFIGPALIALACLCWAIDNNLTRKVSASDALFIASTRGLLAGTVNTALAITMGATLPNFATLSATMAVGLLGYGICLALFVLALRGLGTARTGAYFSTAPFIGAAVATFVFSETTSLAFWIAAVLMGLGVWLHLTARHAHEHLHEVHEHEHAHFPIKHNHPHYADIHHRHVH